MHAPPVRPCRAAPRPRRPAWPAGALLLGAALLLAGACASSQPEPYQEAGTNIDYEARQDYMVDFVTEYPGRVRGQLAERERQRDARNLANWDGVMARRGAYNERLGQRRRSDQANWERIMRRQQAYEARRKQQRQSDVQAFLKLVQRQQQRDTATAQERADRWARYVEQSATAPATPQAPPPAP